MRIITLVLLLSVFVGCTKTIEDIAEKYNDGKTKTTRFYKSEISDENLVKEIQYYPNGDKAYIKSFDNNKPHGEWMFWHSNGNVWSKGSYNNGKRTGQSLVYHENGHLFFTGDYVDGKKDGLWLFYNEEGTLVSKSEFKMGTKVAETDLSDSTTNKEKH